MAIVGDRPTHGLRLRLVRDGTRRYTGAAMTRDRSWELAADVEDDDTVTMTSPCAAPTEVIEYARRVVRIAVRSAREDERPLPRVLQRWRDRDP